MLPYYWKSTVRRILRGKKVCRNCWNYPFACRHIDKEILIAIFQQIEKEKAAGTWKPRKLPKRDTDGLAE